jgi:hypothetical protein
MRTGYRGLTGRAAAAGLMLALAACGGSGASSGGGTLPSAAQYRTSLNALCASAAAFNRSLPHLRQSQHLSVDELAVRASREFTSLRASVARLTPPAALTEADAALVTQLDRQPTSNTPLPNTAATFDRLEKQSRALRSDYTALGATGCAATARAGIAADQADAAAAKKG